MASWLDTLEPVAHRGECVRWGRLLDAASNDVAVLARVTRKNRSVVRRLQEDLDELAALKREHDPGDAYPKILLVLLEEHVRDIIKALDALPSLLKSSREHLGGERNPRATVTGVYLYIAEQDGLEAPIPAQLALAGLALGIDPAPRDARGWRALVDRWGFAAKHYRTVSARCQRVKLYGVEVAPENLPRAVERARRILAEQARERRRERRR
jgi:hypothetical protein